MRAPLWLVDSGQWAIECAAERQRYQLMLTEIAQLSGEREATKARLLLELSRRHERVLAFDHHPATLAVLDREKVDLILSDLRLRKDQTGIELARTAKARGIPTLFATGHDFPGAAEVGIGCVMKPYTERQLCKAIECVDRHLQGEQVKPPKGVELFIQPADESDD